MANVEHNALTDPNLHEPKGVAAAGAGEVYEADGAGSGSWTTLSTGGKTTEVIVASLSDFPTPVSSVITLAADTLYILDGDVNVSGNRFLLSANSGIKAGSSQTSVLTTTSTGNIFTATGNFVLEGFAVTATTGTVFACTGGAFESAYLHNFTINSCSAVGSFTAWYSLFWDKGAMVTCTTGLVMAGACTLFIMDLVEFLAGYTTGVDLGVSTFNTCTFNRCGFGNASATNHINIAASSANINSGKEGRFIQCKFDAGATNVINGSDAGDIRWSYVHNLNSENTTRNAHGYMHTSTTTTISGGTGDSGNPTIVNGGTDWVDAHSDQFTVTTAGRFTYDGVTDIECLILCNISGTTSSGTQTVNHYLAKNGTVVTGSKTQREYSSTAVGSPAPCMAVVLLTTGDYIELYLENITGTNNWDSEILNMTLTEVI